MTIIINPIWDAYMRSKGFTNHHAFLKHEMELWPGGSMTGFMLWVAERKKEFAKQHPEHMFRNWMGHLTMDIVNMDAWYEWVTKENAA